MLITNKVYLYQNKRQSKMFLIKEKLIKTTRSCNKGQTLIEAATLSFVLISLVQMIFSLFFFFISLIWMEHQLYQSVLCVAQQKATSRCQDDLLKRIKKLHRVGKISFVSINAKKGELIWKVYKKDFLIKQELALPE